MSAALQFPLALGDAVSWRRVLKSDWQARELADRHYSRQTVGAADFLPPGRSLVLLTYDGRAVWGVVQNRDPAGAIRWRCTIFRNESSARSSDLIRIATAWTQAYWRARYGEAPPVSLTTEIDPLKVRRKRDPGRCFIRAGWRYVRTTSGAAHGRADLVVLEAPA